MWILVVSVNRANITESFGVCDLQDVSNGDQDMYIFVVLGNSSVEFSQTEC